MQFIRYCFEMAVFATISLLIVAGAQASPGPVSLHVRPIDGTTSQIVVQNLGTSPGASPAISWDVYFNFDHTKATLASVTPGPEWVGMECDFAVNVADGKDPLPTSNDVLINGFCTTRLPAGIVGDEVVVATLNWSNCQDGFVVDLRTGTAEFGAPVTAIVDVTNDPYMLPEDALFDGGACGDTSVGLQTTLNNPEPQPSPLLPAPLLAAGLGTLLLASIVLIARLRRRGS
jgi:hypothetical protein